MKIKEIRAWECPYCDYLWKGMMYNKCIECGETLEPLGVPTTRLDSLKGEDRACPCLYGEPCKPNCTCVNSFSSAGCDNCCTYGSIEQRESKAEYIKLKSFPQVTDSEIRSHAKDIFEPNDNEPQYNNPEGTEIYFEGAKWMRDKAPQDDAQEIPIPEHTHIPFHGGHITWEGKEPPTDKQMAAFEELYKAVERMEPKIERWMCTACKSHFKKKPKQSYCPICNYSALMETTGLTDK